MRLPSPNAQLYRCAGGTVVSSSGVPFRNLAEAESARLAYLVTAVRTVGHEDKPREARAYCLKAARDLQAAIQQAELWRRASRPLAA